MPKLIDAESKLANARGHISELVRIQKEMGKGPGNLVKVTGNVFTDKWEFDSPAAPVPEEARHRFSDAVGNLRSVLDYVAYDLVVLDTGHPQTRTQFPVLNDEAQFEGEIRSRKMNGLTAAHLQRIRELQPFNGCDWIARLAVLSNSDKHKTLVTVARKGNSSAGPTTLTKDRAGKIVKTVRLTLETVIALDDGRHAIALLDELCVHVGAVVSEFKKDF